MAEDQIMDIIKDGSYNEQWLREINNFPSLEQLETNLRELIAVDKTKMTVEEIRQLFYEKVYLFANNSRPVAAPTFNNLKLWRVRSKVAVSENTDVQSTYSYPLSCLCNGRANLKTQPVFYCATSIITALFESKPIAGDVIYLSEWNPSCDQELSIRFLLSESLPKTNPFYDFFLRHLDEMQKMAEVFGQEKAPQLNCIARFISNAFIEEEWPYSLSSWIADDILFGKACVDVLIYPSVARRQISCNIAVKPAFVDKHLSLQHVYKGIVEKNDQGNISFRIMMVGNIDQGHFTWREPTENDDEHLYQHR